MKKAVLYMRYSSASQTEQSIEGQDHVCTDYCDREGWKIVNRYIDRARSASHDTAKRVEFLRMIEDAKKGIFEAVVVYKLDRFARNRYDSAIYKKKLKDAGVQLISATETIASTPEGIIFESVLEGINEYYSADLKQKVERGIGESIRKKKNLGGTTPLGYKVVNGHLAPDPATAHIVQELFQMVADQVPYKVIMDTFNARGYRTCKGKRFTRCSFSKMLHNKKYIGYYCYADIEEPGGQEPLISQELWDEVQRRLAVKGKKKVIEIPYLLTGKLYCGHCGAPMVGESGKSKTDRVYRYYKCQGKKEGSCHKKPVRKEKIEKAVLQAAQDLLAGDRMKKLISMVMDALRSEPAVSRIPELKAQLSDVSKKLDNAVAAVLAGNNSAVLTKVMQDLEADQAELKAALEEQQIREKMQELDADKVEHYIRNLSKIDPERLIDTLVDKVYLYDDDKKNRKMKIVFHLAGDDNTREYFSDSVSAGPAQDPGPCDPVGIVAENAMEQVEGFERCVFFPLPVKSCLVTGKDGVKRNRTHESLRKEVHFSQCHGSVLLYVQKNCLWRMQECQTQPRCSDGFPKQHVLCQSPAGIGVQKFLATSFLVW